MGYTHYWRLNDGKKINSKKLKQAIGVMGKIVKDQDKILASWDGIGKPIVTEKEINFNGKKDFSHENFRIFMNWDGDFDFCKTARKPYDIVVVACLSVLKYYLGDSVRVSSDGEGEELKEGLELAKTYIPELDMESIFSN